jgi:hypothetical protein
MSKTTLSSAVSSATNQNITVLNVQLIRNVTSAEEKSNHSLNYLAVIHGSEVLKLDTKENIRQYIGDIDSKRTMVHKDIETTLIEDPTRFVELNTGACVVCSGIKVDDDKVALHDASLINGGQTKSEIERYFKSLQEDEDIRFPVEELPISLRLEIIVEKDLEVRKQIAIARNTMNPVKNISKAGSLGKLDDLYESMILHNPDWQIQKTETDINNLKTQKVIQVCRLFTPHDLLAGGEVKAYANAEACLMDFCKWYDTKDKNNHSADLYNFTVSKAPIFWEEYLRWDNNPKWKGKRLNEVYETSKKRPAKKLSDGTWKDFATGIIFPMLSGLRHFVHAGDKNILGSPNNTWEYVRPGDDVFDEDEYIKTAINELRDNKYNPLTMGRNRQTYTVLESDPKNIRRFLDRAVNK